jgi:hypothetical protein
MMDKGKGRAIDLDAVDDDLAPSASTRPSTSNGSMKKAYLDNLNNAQLEAVTWSAKGGLQILAGPGSGASVSLCYAQMCGYLTTFPPPIAFTITGKTRVLTSRVAYLVQECGIQPQDLIVVTFTNKVRAFFIASALSVSVAEQRIRTWLMIGHTRPHRLLTK